MLAAEAHFPEIVLDADTARSRLPPLTTKLYVCPVPPDTVQPLKARELLLSVPE